MTNRYLGHLCTSVTHPSKRPPDVAFVKGMIAHHQGAIEMSKIVLQYGKDDQTKKWASDVIREQQREINEMQDWLKKH